MKNTIKCSVIAPLLVFALAYGCSTQSELVPMEQNVNISSSKVKAQFKFQKPDIKFQMTLALTPETQKVVDVLKTSSKGLDIVSEGDEPFEVFAWQNKATEKINGKKLLELLKQNPKLKVEEQKDGIKEYLEHYTELSYWTEGGYSQNEAKKFVASYSKFIKALNTNLKDVQVFLVDDPSNLDDADYNPSDADFSGRVGFYLFGKVGNDMVGVASALIWT
jgi:hypothetical protein